MMDQWLSPEHSPFLCSNFSHFTHVSLCDKGILLASKDSTNQCKNTPSLWYKDTSRHISSDLIYYWFVWNMLYLKPNNVVKYTLYATYWYMREEHKSLSFHQSRRMGFGLWLWFWCVLYAFHVSTFPKSKSNLLFNLVEFFSLKMESEYSKVHFYIHADWCLKHTGFLQWIPLSFGKKKKHTGFTPRNKHLWLANKLHNPKSQHCLGLVSMEVHWSVCVCVFKRVSWRKFLEMFWGKMMIWVSVPYDTTVVELLHRNHSCA
jgi:hypothetical protein